MMVTLMEMIDSPPSHVRASNTRTAESLTEEDVPLKGS